MKLWENTALTEKGTALQNKLFDGQSRRGAFCESEAADTDHRRTAGNYTAAGTDRGRQSRDSCTAGKYRGEGKL